MFEKLGKYLESKYTAQPEEPDKDDFEDCPDKFEPMTKLPHLYTVSDVQIDAVLRELKDCNGVYAAGMLRTLGLLGLPC